MPGACGKGNKSFLLEPNQWLWLPCVPGTLINIKYPLVNKIAVTSAFMELKSVVDIVKEVSSSPQRSMYCIKFIKNENSLVLRSREVSKGSGSEALYGSCWYKLFSSAWELMRGERFALTKVQPVRAGQLAWLKARGQPRHCHGSLIALQPLQITVAHTESSYFIVPDTILRNLHWLCHLILKALT